LFVLVASHPVSSQLIAKDMINGRPRMLSMYMCISMIKMFARSTLVVAPPISFDGSQGVFQNLAR
jgi:hypothetical protein